MHVLQGFCWGSGIVGGIRGKQITLYLLKEAFLPNISIIKFYPCRGESVLPIFWGLNVRGVRKLRRDAETQIHIHIQTTYTRKTFLYQFSPRSPKRGIMT